MKNILWLITDTFRYDNLSDSGDCPVRTPALNRFAAERATSIERFYAGSFPTIPHRTDLAMGRLGWPHYGWQAIHLSGQNHVASILRECGYVSQLICDCPHLINASFQQAFDGAYQHRGQEGDHPLLRLNTPIESIVPDDKTRLSPLFQGRNLPDVHRWANRYYTCEADTFAAKTSGTAVRWLEENYQHNPFFLWVDFFDPHEPWDPPEYLVRRYDPDYDGPPMLHPNYGLSDAYAEAELKNLRAHYAAEAEVVDRMIGRVVQKMNDLDLWDTTVLVVTSDHGMSLGEHGRTGKTNINDADPRYWPIYPEVGHVPFLIAGAGVPAGQRLDLLAQPMDILPTVCDLADVTVDPPEPFEGRSFAEAVREGRHEHRDVAVSGCHVTSKAGERPGKATTPFVVTKQWGYAPVGARGTPELYDLMADPLAEKDVAGENPSVVAEMQGLLLEHLAKHDAPEAFRAVWQREAGDEGSWAID